VTRIRFILPVVTAAIWCCGQPALVEARPVAGAPAAATLDAGTANSPASASPAAPAGNAARDQTAGASTAPAPAPNAAPALDPDDESVLDPAEPDFVVVNLPTTMRLPLHKANFRLTHRFGGNLRNGSFSQQASDLFGLDDGAIIGFEYRYAVMRHVEAAAYRSSFAKTVQFYSKYDALHQGGSMPVSVSGLVSIEGTDNFHSQYAPAVGAVIGRTISSHAAAYVSPMWVGNSNAALHPTGAAGEPARENTFYVGLGGRIRVRPTVYVVGEVTPRLSGYAPDVHEYGFGIEKRVGGHMFALTFTNTFGTTFAQTARGGTANTLYLGFNLARKFF
jgi:hypothetical protein